MNITHIKNVIFESLEWAFGVVGRQFWLFTLVFLIWGIGFFGLLRLVMYFYSFFSLFCSPLSFNVAVVAATVLCTVIAAWFRAGLTAIALRAYDHKPLSFSDSVPSLAVGFKCMVASFLYGLGVSVGTALLVLPGIIFALVYSFYQQYIVDEQVGIIESFEKSAQLTKGLRGNLILAFMVSWVLLWTTALKLAQLFFGFNGAMIAYSFVLLFSVLLYTYLYKVLRNKTSL